MTFKQGESGNPAGRPKGSGQAAKHRARFAEHFDTAFEKLLEKVREGDLSAIKLFMERCVPVLKPSEQPIEIALSGSLTEKGQQVLQAVSEGIIGIEAAGKLLQGISSQGRVVDDTITGQLEELAKRLEELEASRGKGRTLNPAA